MSSFKTQLEPTHWGDRPPEAKLESAMPERHRLLTQAVPHSLNNIISCLLRLPPGLPSVIGVASSVLVGIAAIPQVAQAYTVQTNIAVQRGTGEGYDALTHRAEMAARATAQGSFDSDILVTEVSITVVGESGGLAAPILVLDVSRNDWRSRPDPRRWATYFRSTRALLDLNNGDTARQEQPATSVTSPIPTPNQASPSPTAAPRSAPATIPNSSQPAEEPVPGSSPNPAINIPATPAGEVGLPRSILR